MKRSASSAQSRRVSGLSLLSLAALAACSGSGGGAIGSTTARSEFRVVRTEPVNGATIFLNDPIAIDFTSTVDVDSATLTTMTFQALDQNGVPVSELVTGNFSIGTTPGDASPGRRLLFVPRFATNNDFSDGGFKSGRTYLVQLIGGRANNLTTLRDTTGRGLTLPITFEFSTRDGTQPVQLYRNPKSGGPVRTGLDVTTTTDLQNVPLGLFGAPPLEIRLHFDQALNPNDGNVPVSFDVDPEVREESERGRVFLEYKDPVYDSPTDDQDFTWIPASVELERTTSTGATA
ncbi:MAG: hypothetical protein H6835_19050 [Planctomycetes bacterium]|nr:hypothetical protein [Planctomycetota bacterium]